LPSPHFPGASQGGDSGDPDDEGTTDVEEGGAQGFRVDDRDGGEGWSYEDGGGSELGCGIDERLARDLGPGIDGAAAQCATSVDAQ
jgi:hypothetical protein